MAARSSGRPPTPGEGGLITDVFGDAIDAAHVRFHRAKWWLFQPRHIVMAPDGHIWFHPTNPSWRDDFSTAPLALRALIVHELTHVWQHQRGISLPLRRHPFCRYGYAIKPGRRFTAYGLEQQAEIVRHAYVLREGGEVPGAPALDIYAALIPFGRWREMKMPDGPLP